MHEESWWWLSETPAMLAGPCNIYSDERFVCVCTSLQQMICNLKFKIKPALYNTAGEDMRFWLWKLTLTRKLLGCNVPCTLCFIRPFCRSDTECALLHTTLASLKYVTVIPPKLSKYGWLSKKSISHENCTQWGQWIILRNLDVLFNARSSAKEIPSPAYVYDGRWQCFITNTIAKNLIIP